MLYSKLQIDKVYLISYFFINLEVYMLQSGKVRVSVLNSLGAWPNLYSLAVSYMEVQVATFSHSV